MSGWSVASVCGWSEQAKLVNLITRLRGPAYSFYRSCAPPQRSDFQALTAALTKRFTPVNMKSVQSSRFHDRKQQEAKTVDNYAQELKKLFYRAYPATQQGSQEAEAMGRSVLACQFVAGLRNTIKAKAPVVVRLIQTTRLPPQHSKRVRARVDCRSVKACTLFQPENETLERRGLQMEDGAAEADEGGFLTLAVQNHSLGPVHLKKGEILRALHQAEVWDTLVCPDKAEVKTICAQETGGSVKQEPQEGEGCPSLQ